MKVLVPFGTRPEIIKLSPVLAALDAAGVQTHKVATGQHHLPGLSDVFLEDLAVHPDERWELPGAEAARVGAILAGAYDSIGRQRPDVVLALGDTHTVPLFSLAARRHQVPVVHLEAGLRSFNPASMEEVNRRVAAATASLHLAPTALAAQHLLSEGVPAERVRVVGNPVLDVLRLRGLKALPPGERHGVVVTAHRATNVDDPARAARLKAIVIALARQMGPVSFPLHPRTSDRLGRSGALEEMESAGVRLLPALPSAEMLGLLAGSRLVITDSGGLQEEAAWLGIPVVVLRTSTPRWEGVLAGTSELAGLDLDRALAAATRFCHPSEQERVAAVPCPYGDGHTSERVARILTDPGVGELLHLAEPVLDTRAGPPGAAGHARDVLERPATSSTTMEA